MNTTNSDKGLVSVLIIADIEGSYGCLQRADAQLFNDGWVRACVLLTREINLIVDELFAGGKVSRVKVKDFHRTGFNIFADQLDQRAELSQGYDTGPIIGIGDCAGFDLLFLVGLHAASGSDGFLPHTLTSRFASLKFNQRLLPEAELFAASVASAAIKPVFFSGETLACNQAHAAMPWLVTHAVDKPLSESIDKLQQKMRSKVREAVQAKAARLYLGNEPGQVEIVFRDGVAAAEKAARLWKLEREGEKVVFSVNDLNQAYDRLLQIAYLTPFWARHLSFGLKLFRLWGHFTHAWALRRRAHLQV